jgi:ankyrin repeat protein
MKYNSMAVNHAISEQLIDSPMHQAALNGDLVRVKKLVRSNYDIDFKLRNGDTPIHLAAHASCIDVVGFLLESGADANQRNIEGHSPIHFAVFPWFRGYPRKDDPSLWLECVKCLVSGGAFIDSTNCFGQTALHLCARLADGYGSNVAIIEYLLESGADVNKQDRDGWSVLHHLYDCDNVGTFQTLLGYGANPWLKNSEGKTILDLLDEPKVFDLDDIDLVKQVLRLVPQTDTRN